MTAEPTVKGNNGNACATLIYVKRFASRQAEHFAP
jgi:hypothetical protein